MTRPIIEMICCPRCRSDLRRADEAMFCTGTTCPYSQTGFPLAAGQPVLIDFEDSIFDRERYLHQSGSILDRDEAGEGFRTRLQRFLLANERVEPAQFLEMRKRLKQFTAKPLVLTIGGGAIGSGPKILHDDPDIQIVGTDVYASRYTEALVDAHRLPFRSGVFDGVVMQAVLEHVLDPHVVVDEVFRVLKPGGLLFAGTPFMQPVHEAAYDFTRFTRSGHRWLLRNFEEIDAGPVGGAAISFVWALRYMVRALGFGDKIATLSIMPFFWVKYLERLMNTRANSDAASGHYFLGSKATLPLSAKDMPAYYVRKIGPATPAAGAARLSQDSPVTDRVLASN